MIQFSCPQCGRSFNVKDDTAGKQGKCPDCGQLILIPSASPAPAAVVAPQPATPAMVIPEGTRPTQQRHRSKTTTRRAPARDTVPKSTNGLGVAALVLGIIATLTCWIPFIAMLGMPLAVLGLLFGIIGFLIAAIGRKSGVGMPVSGSIVCIIALAVGIAVTEGASQAIEESLGGVSNDSTASVQVAQEEAEYIRTSLRIQNLEVADAVLSDKGVFGEIKNTGDRTLDKVQITVYCLDAQDKPVYETTFHPVLVSDWSLGDSKPLKPNYTEKFGYGLDDAPSEWTGKIRAKISEIAFAQ